MPSLGSSPEPQSSEVHATLGDSAIADASALTRRRLGLPPAATHVAEESVQAVPNGPAVAALLGAALGVFAMGVMFKLSHSRSDLAQWLVFREQVGALSGLSTMAGVVWVSSWSLLTVPLWKRSVPLLPVVAIAGLLIALGLLLTVPQISERIEL